jgi:hypothetical protein
MISRNLLLQAKVPVFLLTLLGSVSVMADQGGMWHTIRDNNGVWLPFGNVRAVTGFSGQFSDVAIAGNDASGELHVVGLDSLSTPQHTIRAADGTWLNFGDVTSLAGNPGIVTQVSTALIGCELHVIVTAAFISEKLYHTIRYCNGDWQDFRDVTLQAGNRGSIRDVSIAGDSVSGALHVVVSTSGGGVHGGLWHTIRAANGSWLPFGYVGSPDDSWYVATALIGCNLHVVAATPSGLWHTIRYCNGNWSPFGNVTPQQLWDVSIAGDSASGELHVVTTDYTRVLHTIRNYNGTWSPWTDVTAQVGSPACLISTVGAGLIGGSLHLAVITYDCDPSE